MKSIYFDTNVYNHICDNYGFSETESLLHKLNSHDFALFLSPINILEFLQNSDDLRREKLVYLCQTICNSNLLVEPESLIVDYVAKSTQNPDVIHLLLDNFHSRSPIGATWRSIQANKLKTFVFDKQEIGNFNILKELHSFFHAHYSRNGTLKNILNEFDLMPSGIRESLSTYSDLIRQQPAPSKRDPSIPEHIWVLISQIFCIGCTIFPNAIDDYWTSIGIGDTTKRLNHAFNDLKFLCEHGPFVGMAALMSWQATKKYNPGNLYDCYHLLYLPHVDNFITGDTAFHAFRDHHSGSEMLKRITTPHDFLSSLGA